MDPNLSMFEIFVDNFCVLSTPRFHLLKSLAVSTPHHTSTPSIAIFNFRGIYFVCVIDLYVLHQIIM